MKGNNEVMATTETMHMGGSPGRIPNVFVGDDLNTPTEVAPNLFVAGIGACNSFDGVAFNVTEGAPCENSHCSQITILSRELLAPTIARRDPTIARRDRLDELADLVIPILRNGTEKVLIHCWAGMERSPLSCAWILKRMRKIELRRAWKIVKKKRTVAQDRRYWLREGHPMYSRQRVAETAKQTQGQTQGLLSWWDDGETRSKTGIGGFRMGLDGKWYAEPVEDSKGDPFL